jgi:hypothetical protein
MLTDTTTHPPTLRENVESLGGRLARISAQRAVLAGVADSIEGTTSPTLAHVLETLERDLTLAAREAGRLHDLAEGS